MGFSQNNKSSGTLTALSEINVTPFVDVMLVLLIVFMVSAPLMQQGAQVDLPKADAGNLSEAPEQILLEVSRSQKIKMNGKAVRKGKLLSQLLDFRSVKPDVQVFVQADRRVSYGFIARVIAEVKKAKITRVGLVTLPGDSQSRL